jgi:transcriptional regulator PpsR
MMTSILLQSVLVSSVSRKACIGLVSYIVTVSISCIGSSMSGLTISQPDVTLLLDLDGVIREATLADGLPTEAAQSWVGRHWGDTVADGAGDKVRRILQDARTAGVSAYRMVDQRFPNGLELAVEYSTIRLGGEAGMIAIGKNQQTVAALQHRLIAAQQAREQDYWKLREVETRYRLLFDTSSEVVLVIRAEGLRVMEANLAALRALGLTPGQDLLPELSPTEHEAFRAMLARVHEQGRAPGIVVHLGVDRSAWTMRASLMSAEPARAFLLQLSPMAALSAPSAHAPMPRAANPTLPIEDLLERVPDAFVVIDQNGAILRANAAFLDLIQAGAEGSVLGERLGRWLSHPGADLAALLATVQRDRFVRRFATTLQGELASDIEVEISAAGNADGQPRFFALLIRDVSRRIAVAGGDACGCVPVATDGHTLLAALGAMADDLGQTSLPTLIKQTVGLVERHYIEAALERADGNRTATAELLGLSRQSLYMKLNRYGLENESRAAMSGELISLRSDPS